MRELLDARWSEKKAWEWYDAKPWLCGFNYVPSTAVNTTDMWQRETFDAETIRRELGWASEIGLNCCRIFVQFLVWQADPQGLLSRLDQFFALAAEKDQSTLVVLFDDCAFAGKEPYLGPQAKPVPGIHNSGWTPSPGPRLADDADVWSHLEAYVTAIVSRFAADPRVLGWDVYNEPGNSERYSRSLPLLQAAFGWVRQARPLQPLTSGLWHWETRFDEINSFLLKASDVVTYHEYAGLDAARETLARLEAQGRPVLCTEWMSRTLGSHFETHLPLFRAENAGCFFWGLVNGRTQTHFPWKSEENAPPPEVWFHDLLHSEGQPYRPEEVALIGDTLAVASKTP